MDWGKQFQRLHGSAEHFTRQIRSGELKPFIPSFVKGLAPGGFALVEQMAHLLPAQYLF